jgi:hypothetical protein
MVLVGSALPQAGQCLSKANAAHNILDRVKPFLVGICGRSGYLSATPRVQDLLHQALCACS